MNPDFWSNKSVIVTGGTGFVGSHIVRRLQQNCRSIAIASRAFGVDLSLWEECIAFFREHPADVVINCAALQGGLRFNELSPGEIYYKNLLMGAHAMEAARQTQVKKYVNLVAGCSYPGYIDGTLSEDRYWEGPLHESVVNYGLTKKAQTIQGWAYKKQYGFSSIHLLLTNLYGPGEHLEPDRSHALAALVRKFTDAVDRGAPEVEVWGTGRPIREWLYIDDAVEAIIRAAECYDDITPLNIGTGIGHTIKELAETIAESVGFKGRINYDVSRPDGAMRKVFDVSRMKDVLRWEPETPLTDGIRQMVAFYREYVSDRKSEL